MVDYIRPAGNAAISSSWQDHKNRRPPSVEPGTDYACPYGTPVRAPQAGVVDAPYGVDNSAEGAAGRAVMLHFDDGNWGRALHLSRILVKPGQRVAQGEVIAYSGASANGRDWGVGPHCHWSFWPGRGNTAPSPGGTPTADFEAFLARQAQPASVEAQWPARERYGEAWVKKGQAKLIKLGYHLGSAGVDGRDGPATQAAVRALQKQGHLTVDGIYGPATDAYADKRLNAKTRPTSVYPAVTVALLGQIGDVRGLQKIANLYLSADDKTALDNRWEWRSQRGFLAFLKQSGYGTVDNWLRSRWGYKGNNRLGPVMTAALKRANAANSRAL